MKAKREYNPIFEEVIYTVIGDNLELWYNSKGYEVTGTINGKKLRKHNVVGFQSNKVLSNKEVETLKQAKTLMNTIYRPEVKK